MHYRRISVLYGAEASVATRSDLSTYLTLNIMHIDAHPVSHAESGMRSNAGGSPRPEVYLVISDSNQLNLPIP